MRITNGMLITNMMRNYNKNMKDLAKLQEHLASGKKILRPSDDPVAISRSLKLKADLAYNKQYVAIPIMPFHGWNLPNWLLKIRGCSSKG